LRRAGAAHPRHWHRGGCIAVACARYFPRARVVATDISTAALALAAVNAPLFAYAPGCACGARISFRRGRGPFDLIVANPPYVGTREYAALRWNIAASRDSAVFRARRPRRRAPDPGAGADIPDASGYSHRRSRHSDRALAKAFRGCRSCGSNSRGGGGVFLLTRAELERHAADFEAHWTIDSVGPQGHVRQHIRQALHRHDFGESHGPAIGCVSTAARRVLRLPKAICSGRRSAASGHFAIHEPAREPDQVRILSGVSKGSPPALRSASWSTTSINAHATTKDQGRFRPGHADYTYQQKYGRRDYRGGGRSSARETVMRVAAGAIARKYLRERCAIEISGYLSQIGSLVLDPVDPRSAYDNPFFCPDPARVPEPRAAHLKLRKKVTRSAHASPSCDGLPPGLGEPVFIGSMPMSRTR